MANPTGSGKTLHGLFEERVRAAPDHVALVHDDQKVTYAELDRAAGKVAHYLRESSGVRPDDRVAILVRNPVSEITAVLAALKAGGSYVPLDTDNPPAVTKQILEEATPAAVVLESEMVKNVAFFDGDMFIMDVMSEGLAEPAGDLAPLSAAENLAYVIFTSGTMGTPKGVAIEHRAILNTVTWRNSYYGFGSGAVILAIPRLAYDSSVADIFCMLTSGGTLVLPDRARITSRSYIAGLIEDRGVTHFTVTPGLYKRLVGGLAQDTATALRTVTLAGEWFTGDLVSDHYRRLPQVALHNEYGPAENSVCSTACRLDAQDTVVLIGGPIDNVTAFAVKDDGVIAGPGESGELFLAGEGLARGYHGNPELTAERFFRRRSPDGEDVRVYRSGDLVQVHPGGAFQFLGRRDNQVKIRGRRVELGHIAACLLASPGVNDVFVLNYVTEAGAPVIIAFTVGPADTGQLRAVATRSLPGYMVPAAIISLDEIPLGKNGKVDSDALIRAYTALVAGHETGRVPGSAREGSLIMLFQRLFPHLEVGLDHDFFLDLGGDSLLAMELVTSLEEMSGIRIGNADVYETRTVRKLARRLDGADT